MATLERKTVSSNTESAQYVEFDEFVDYHVERTRSNIQSTEVFTTVLWLAVAAVGYLLAFVIADHWFLSGGVPVALRTLLLLTVIVGIAVVAVWRVVLPLRRNIHPLYAARVIENAEPALQSSVVNYVDIRDSGRKTAVPISKSLEKRAAVGLSHMDVDSAVDRGRLLRVAFVLLGVIVSASLYSALSPKDVLTSVKRALLPVADIAPPTRTIIADVSPGDQTVPLRNSLDVECELRGVIPRRVHLLFTTADRRFVDQTVEMRLIGEHSARYRAVLNGENGRGLTGNLTYRIVAGDVATRDYFVTVVQPPMADVLEVEYVPPTYTGLPPGTSAGGQIDAYDGTIVRLKGQTTRPSKTATLVFTDAESTAQRGEERLCQLSEEGTKFTAEWKLAFRSDGTSPKFYHVNAIGPDGARDPEPTQYSIRIRADLPPDVSILAPSGDIERPANATVPFSVAASDPDFKLASVTLKAARNEEVLVEQPLFDDRQELGQAVRGGYDLELQKLNLKTGEILQVWVEARDNRKPNANRSSTPRINIRIQAPVSKEDANKQLAQDRQQQQDQLASADPNVNPPPERNPEEPQPQNQNNEPNARRNPDEAPDRQRNPADNNPRQTGEEDAKERRPPPPNNQERNQDGNPDQPGEATDREQKSVKNDGSEDDRVLEKLLQREEQRQREQQKKQPNPEQGETGEGDPQTDDSTDGEQGADQKDASTSKSKQGKTGKQSGGEDADSKGENSGQGGKGKADARPGDKSTNKSNGSKSEPSKSGERQTDSNMSNGDDPQEQSADDPSPQPSPLPSDQENAKAKSGKNNTKSGNNNAKSGAEKSGAEKSGAEKSGEGSQSGSDNSPDSTDKPSRGDRSKRGQKQKGERPDQSNPADQPNADQPNADQPGEDDRPVPVGKTGEGDEKSTSEKKDGADSTEPVNKGAAKTPGRKSEPAEPSEPGDEELPSKTGGNTGEEKGPDEKSSGQGKPASDPTKGSEVEQEENPDGEKNAGKSKPENKGVREKTETDSTKPGEENKSATGRPDGKRPDGGKSPNKGGDEESKDASQQRTGSKGSSNNPGKSKAASARKTQDPQEANPDETPSDEPAEQRSDDEAEKNPGDTDLGNDDLRGKGTKGQRSDNKSDAQGGEAGGSKANDQGTKGSPREGAGDTSDDPGNSDPSRKPNAGKSSNQKGKGSRNRPSTEGEKSSDTGEPTESKPGDPPPKGKSNKAAPDGKQSGDDSETGSDPESPRRGRGGAGEESKQSATDDSDSSPSSESEEQSNGESSDGKSNDGKTGDGKSGKQPGNGSEKPGSGEPGQESSCKNGTPSDQPGSGDKQGNQSAGGQPKQGAKDGQRGKPGPNQGSNGNRNGQPGQPSDGPNNPAAGGARTDGSTPEPGDESGDERGNEQGDGGDGNPGENEPVQRVLNQERDDQEAAEKANLNYARKASDLILRKIKDQLARGEVDEETLKELGWTRSDMEKFAARLEKNLEEPDDQSPEALARKRQFEESLKAMRLKGSTGKLKGQSVRKERTQQVDVGSTPVPVEYQDVYEAYTKSLSAGMGAGTESGTPAAASAGPASSTPRNDSPKKKK